MANAADKPDSFFDALGLHAKNIRQQMTQVRLAAQDAVREVQSTVEESRDHMKKHRPPWNSEHHPESEIIDLGRKPGAAKRFVQAGVAIVVLGLMASGAIAFAAFVLQIALAFLLAISILGLRIDLGPGHFAGR